MASNLVENHLQGIVDKDKNHHMSKRPGDKLIIDGVMGGWHAEIAKKKKEV